MDANTFYQSLNDLEKKYWNRLNTVFQKVNPQKPEKGIQVLILRAREVVKTQNISLESALEKTLEGAVERTERRVQLLSQCVLKTNESDPHQP